MMRKLLALTLLLVAAVSAIGCAGLSKEEKAQYLEITEPPPRGLGLEPQEKVSLTAAWLLPPLVDGIYVTAATGNFGPVVWGIGEGIAAASFTSAGLQSARKDYSGQPASANVYTGAIVASGLVSTLALKIPTVVTAANINKRYTIWWYMDPTGPGNELYRRKKDELRPPRPEVIPAAKAALIPSEK